MKEKKVLLHGIEIVAVGEASLIRAQNRVTGCESCSPSASRPFESLLDQTLGNNGTTEYFLCSPSKCPRCAARIFEKTLVDFAGKPKAARRPLKYFDARDEGQDVIFIDEPTLMEAQGFVTACEHCSERAEIPFDQLLDAVTGHDPTTTEYVICRPARCGSCRHDVMEKTLVLTL